MNQSSRLFFEYLLTRNSGFILFFTILLPAVSGLTVRQAFPAGLKYALMLFLSSLVTSALSSALPEALPFLFPGVVYLITLLTVLILLKWGELKGEWAGIPMALFAFLPYGGTLMHLGSVNLSGTDLVYASAGAAGGFYVSFILVITFIEQIRLSEAPKQYKRTGTLFFAIALFALGLAGFQFF